MGACYIELSAGETLTADFPFFFFMKIKTISSFAWIYLSITDPSQSTKRWSTEIEVLQLITVDPLKSLA